MKSFLYLTLFLIPFYFFRFSILGIPTNLFELAVLILLIWFLIEHYKNGKYPFASIPKNYLYPAIGIALALLIGFLVSAQKMDSLGIIKSWFIVPGALTFIIASTVRRQEIKYLSLPLYFSMLIVSLWAILQKFGLITTLFYQRGDLSFADYLLHGVRAFGPFESPNYLAMFLVPVIFLSLPLYFALKKKQQILFGLSFILPVLAIIFSASSGGILALIAAIAVFIYFWNRPFFQARKKITYGALAVVIIGVAFVIYTAYTDASSVVRLDIYRYSLTMLSDHWFFGIGLSDFKDQIMSLAARKSSFLLYNASYAIHPQSLFLALWLNLGIIGFASFIWLIVSLIKKMLILPARATSFFAASMAAILVHGLFDTTYFKNDLSVIFWLLIAFSLILSSNEKTLQ